MIRENTANHFTWLGLDLRLPPGWRPLAMGLLIGLALGAALSTVASRGLELWERLPAQRVVTLEWPSERLPSEWRWSPRAVKVDHMFRQLGGGAR